MADIYIYINSADPKIEESTNITAKKLINPQFNRNIYIHIFVSPTITKGSNLHMGTKWASFPLPTALFILSDCPCLSSSIREFCLHVKTASFMCTEEVFDHRPSSPK